MNRNPLDKEQLIADMENEGSYVSPESPFYPSLLPIDRSPLSLEEEPTQIKPVDILEKFKSLTQQREVPDLDYVDSTKMNDDSQTRANVLRSAQGMLQNIMSFSNPRFQADNSVADNISKEGTNRLNEFYKLREEARRAQDQGFDVEKNKMNLEGASIDLENKRQMNASEGTVPDVFRTILQKTGKLSPEQVKGLNAVQSKSLIDTLVRQNELGMNQALGWARLQEMKEGRELAREDRLEAKKRQGEIRQEQVLDINTQKLAKDLSGAQDLLNSYQILESELGSPLENYDASGEILKKDGKPVDLPGVSIPGVGRTSFYSDKAQRLSSAAERIFNVTLKDRSGAAVTTPEMDRLRNEYMSGRFNTETQLIKAMQNYKQAALTALKNKEAGYSPDVLKNYAEAGGVTSGTFQNKKEQTVGPYGETVERNGKMYKWNSSANKYQPIE
jgi:hypothetical protein